MTAARRPSSALLTSSALLNGIHGVIARSICLSSADRLRSTVEFSADKHVISKSGIGLHPREAGVIRPTGYGLHRCTREVMGEDV
jgi:hypothetical protein